MKSYVFKMIIEPDEDRWFAHCPVLEEKGAATWGYTQEEALKNIEEVLEMTVRSMAKHGEAIPEKREEVMIFSDSRIAVTIKEA